MCIDRCVLSVSLTPDLQAKSPTVFFLFKLISDLSANAELYRQIQKAQTIHLTLLSTLAPVTVTHLVFRESNDFSSPFMRAPSGF